MKDNLYQRIEEFETLLAGCPSLFGVALVPENKILTVLSNIYEALPQEIKANKNALAEKLGENNVYYILHTLEQYIRSAHKFFGIKVIRKFIIIKYLDAMYAAMPDNMKAVIDTVRGIEKTNDRIG